MKLVRASLTEYYTAENGDHASITVRPDDTSCLIVCKQINNELSFKQEYTSRRAALIAMHKRCGACKFNSMTNTFVKGE